MKAFFGWLALILAVVLIGGSLIMAAITSARTVPVAVAPVVNHSPICTAADFAVSKTKVVTEYEAATLTGVVTNHCTSSAGIKLKWTAYNHDGSVAFSNDFWPASTTNIPPGAAYPFQGMNAAPRGRWTYTVAPISVDVW